MDEFMEVRKQLMKLGFEWECPCDDCCSPTLDQLLQEIDNKGHRVELYTNKGEPRHECWVYLISDGISSGAVAGKGNTRELAAALALREILRGGAR